MKNWSNCFSFFIVLLLSTNIVEAACTAPSGVYSGVANFSKYTESTVLDLVYNMQMTASISYSAKNASRPVNATMTNTVYQNGSTSFSKNIITTISSTFNSVNCLGTLTMSDGLTYPFAITGSGSEINFIVVPPSTNIFYFIVQGILKKV